MVTITPAVREGMIRHAEGAYPEECCGILLGIGQGEDVRITEAVAAANAAGADRGRRYEMEPGAIVRAEAAGRGWGDSGFREVFEL